MMLQHPLCGNPDVLIALLARDVIMLSGFYDVLIKNEHLIFLSGVLQTKDSIKNKECEEEETENKLLISNEIKGKLAVLHLFHIKVCRTKEVWYSLKFFMKLHCNVFSTFAICVQKFLDSNTFTTVFLYLVIIKGFAKNFIADVKMSAKWILV